MGKYKDMPPEQAARIQARQHEYYEARKEEMLEYQREYRRRNKTSNKAKRAKGYIRYFLASVRSGGYLGVQWNFKNEKVEDTYKREAFDTSIHISRLQHSHGDRFIALFNDVVSERRLLTM